MCLVFLTSSSVLWTLSSLFSSTLLLSGHLTPSWLLGNPVILKHNYPPPYGGVEGVDVPEVAHEHITVWTGALTVRPSLGMWIRCTIMAGRKGVASSQHCGVYATSGADLPALQVVTMACLVTGTGLAVIASLLSILAACQRVVCRKSIFNVTGALQALAAVFSVLGLVIYPLSWRSTRVRLMCGPMADIFYSGGCDIGWALYTTLAGTLLLLFCAMYSLHVDGSISSNRAEDEIRRGNHFVCIT